MGNVAPWIVKILAGVAILFTVSVWLSAAFSLIPWSRVSNYFFAILALWILSIVLAVRNTPRVDSPSRIAYNFWRVMIVVTSVAMLSSVLFPVFVRPKSGGGPGSVCRARMKQLSIAMSIYLNGSGGMYPPADRWADALAPHLKKLWQCPDSKAAYSYGMNKSLGGLRRDQVADPESTVLFFEMDSKDRNAHGTATDLALRHGAGYVFVSVDGILRYSTRHKMTWRP